MKNLKDLLLESLSDLTPSQKRLVSKCKYKPTSFNKDGFPLFEGPEFPEFKKGVPFTHIFYAIYWFCIRTEVPNFETRRKTTGYTYMNDTNETLAGMLSSCMCAFDVIEPVKGLKNPEDSHLLDEFVRENDDMLTTMLFDMKTYLAKNWKAVGYSTRLPYC